MEELVDESKVRSIGVSNFNIEQLSEILMNCRIPPVCNQIEVHPLLQNIELAEFCQSKNIAVVAYAPLGAPARPWVKFRLNF
jgi:diketogulonate reductase-like aldo/keto reductase